MAGSLFYADSVFADADWDTYHEGTGTLNAAEQEPELGNPAPSRYVQNTTSSGTVYGFHFKKDATWDPANSQGIESIEFSIDGMSIAPVSGVGMGYTFAIRQGGRNFEVVTSVGVGSVAGVWNTLTYSGLTATSFQTVSGSLEHPDFGPTGGVVTLGFRTGNTQAFPVTNQALFDNWSVTITPVSTPVVPPGEPGGPAVQSPMDYVRLSVSVDAGSLLDSTVVPVVESGISITFDPVVTLDQSALYPVWEPLRERGVGDPDHVFYPRGIQSTDRLNHYAGETILTWIDRVRAPRLFAKVSDLPDLAGDLIGGRFVTLQVAVAYWFDTLASRYAPRFQHAPVPDLRFATPEGAYDTGQGTPLVELFTFDQPRGSELSIRQVLDQMLSVCGGQAAVLVKQDALGRLQLVPSVGPDAVTEPAIVLTPDDVERVSTGDRDPRGSINSATARNTVWTEQDDVGIMQPAWFQIGSIGRFGLDGWFEAPTDRQNLQPTDDPAEPLQEALPPGSPFGRQRPGLWPISGTALPGAGGIRLRDSGGTYMVEVAWRRYLGTGSLQESGTTGLVADLDEIPITGEWVTPFRWGLTVGGEGVFIDVRARWNGTGVELSFGNVKLESACFIPPCDLWVVEFNLSDASRGFAPGAELSATFSLENGDLLPSPAGGNALAESEDEFGIQHAELNISVVSLGPTDLADLARAFVIANIEPKLVREVEQSPRRGFPVRPAHVGYRVQLPSGEVGRVPSRTIDADYARPGAGSIRSTFRSEITEVRVAPADDWLLNDDGSFWANDDGTPSEPA